MRTNGLKIEDEMIIAMMQQEKLESQEEKVEFFDEDWLNWN